jgi:hypothetical protein
VEKGLKDIFIKQYLMAFGYKINFPLFCKAQRCFMNLDNECIEAERHVFGPFSTEREKTCSCLGANLDRLFAFGVVVSGYFLSAKRTIYDGIRHGMFICLIMNFDIHLGCKFSANSSNVIKALKADKVIFVATT